MRSDRPSVTAIKIARGIVFVGEDPRVRELLPPGNVELNAQRLREANLLTPSTEKLYRNGYSGAS